MAADDGCEDNVIILTHDGPNMWSYCLGIWEWVGPFFPAVAFGAPGSVKLGS